MHPTERAMLVFPRYIRELKPLQNKIAINALALPSTININDG